MKLYKTILKYHEWYLCQISLQIMLLPIQIVFSSLKISKFFWWSLPPDPPSGSRLRCSRAPPLILPLLRHWFLYGRFIRLIYQSKKTVQSVRHQFQLVYFAARSLMFRGKLSLFPPIVFRKDHERNRCSWFSCSKGSGNYCRLARSCA